MSKTRPMNGKKNLPTSTAIISKWTFTSVWSFASLRENYDDLYMRFYVLFYDNAMPDHKRLVFVLVATDKPVLFQGCALAQYCIWRACPELHAHAQI